MTKEQREEVESILCTVFDGFTDERLKGRYYSMTKMSEEEKKDLVRPWFFFKSTASSKKKVFFSD